MQKSLFKALSSEFGPGAARRDVLLVCEVHAPHHEGPQATYFCLLAGALGRHGRHPAQQSFLMYRQPAWVDNEYAGMALEAAREDFHKMRERDSDGHGLHSLFDCPLDGQHAAPCILSEGALAAKLLNSVLPEWPTRQGGPKKGVASVIVCFSKASLR
jgi:hypothetical protein